MCVLSRSSIVAARQTEEAQAGIAVTVGPLGVSVLSKLRMEITVIKKLAILCAVTLTVLTISMRLFSSARHNANNPGPQSADLAYVVAGPGMIEPVSENIKVGSEMSGKLKSVNVEEGDSIRAGQVLAVLENDDYRAELASSAAEVQAKEATLRKVVNGSRAQERSEALAGVRAFEAVVKNAQAELQRRQELYDSGVISREELDHYTREYDVAKEEYQEKSDRYSLVNAATREEDVAFARADVQLAQAHLAEAQARYDKTFIKSPINGIVLRKHHRNGESVSNSATTPDPVLTIGNTEMLRVRVDIDESDVNKVRMGQKAWVTADAFGKQKFSGHVVRIGELLGPKTIRTDEPTERVDRKFLELLVELDPAANLPVGLRVDTFILSGYEQSAALR